MSNYVFLDTQVFVQNHFLMNNKNFLTLIEHLDNGDTILIISPILIDEIKKHIKTQINSVIKSIKDYPILKVLKNNNVISNDIWQKSSGFKDELSDEIFRILDSELFSFATTVDLKYASNESVFDDFFKKVAPFLSGKPEFPDAFIASSLLGWAKQKKCKISIVSGNTRDWEAICKRQEYVEKFVFHEDLSGFLSSITTILEEEKNSIETNIKNLFTDVFLDKFRNIDIELDSDLQVWDEFDCPELDSNSVKIKILKINITSYVSSDDEAEAEVQGIVEFESHIDCPNPDSWVYDSEEKEIMFYSERLTGKVESKRDFSCFIKICKSNDTYEIADFEIDEPRRIELEWGGIDPYSNNDNFIPDPYEHEEEE